MASKVKHAKRSKYSSHNYKAFSMFIRNAEIKKNAMFVTSHALTPRALKEEA